jgi:hypothetical protein
MIQTAHRIETTRTEPVRRGPIRSIRDVTRLAG